MMCINVPMLVVLKIMPEVVLFICLSLFGCCGAISVRNTVFWRCFSLWRSRRVFHDGDRKITRLVAVSCVLFTRYQRWPSQEIPEVGSNGAVASEHPACSKVSWTDETAVIWKVGVDVLKDGGSAVDAAIAAALCIGTINCFSSGIGGGPGGFSEVLDFRETAPGAANKTMFAKNPKLSQIGGLAVGVPGEIRAFEVAHQKYGKLSWSRLFQPSIALARDGFKVTKVMESRIRFESEYILKDEKFRSIFAPDGRLLVEGEWIRRANYSKTLELLAAGNASAIFYRGKIAQSLVETIREANGVMTLEDFAQYDVIIRKPLVGYYHGRKILTVPPPASGAILLSILNIVERFNFPATGLTKLNLHRLVEAFKHGFAERTELGDTAFINITERLYEIISKDYASALRSNISDAKTFPVDYYHPHFEPVETPGTTHLSVLDKSGMAVSMTSTINLIFGAKLMDQTTGIILNNEMDDFSSPNITNAFGLPPSKNNFIAPGKRPLSSTVPTIVEQDGDIYMTIGASGGSRIITSTVQAMLNVLDGHMNIQEAISAPRIHHQLLPDKLFYEPRYSPDSISFLEEKRHVVEKMNEATGDVQGIIRFPNGIIHAGADPRKGGKAAAY